MNDIATLAAFADEQQRNGLFAAASAAFGKLFQVTHDPAHLMRAAANARAASDGLTAIALAHVLLQEFGTAYQPCMEAGFCNLQAGAAAEAFAAFHAAYRCERNADSAAWCGVALRLDGNPSAACDYHRLALNLQPGHRVATIELANSLVDMGAFAAAIELYRRLVETPHSPAHSYFFNRLGICCERAGRKDLLAALLDDPRYFDHLDADYAPEAMLRWSLQLRKPIDDAALLRTLLTRSRIADGTFDMLTLYVMARVGADHPLSRAYHHLFQSSPYGRVAEHVLLAYPPERIQESLSRVTLAPADAAIESICRHVREGRTFSLVRIGDGEGNLLGHLLEPENAFLRRQAELILQIWFGDEAKPIAEYAALFDDLRESIREADLLGVPGSARLEFEKLNDARGYWGTYFGALHCCTQARNGRFVTPDLHFHLFRYPSFVAALRSAATIHTVSCHTRLGPRLRAELGVASGTDLVVPGEMTTGALPPQARSGKHYPDGYQRVAAGIACFQPGSVVLIAAGACGKAYAHWAKQAGCVAIDIGAMADFLMGCNTRPVFSAPDFRKAHGWARHMISL